MIDVKSAAELIRAHFIDLEISNHKLDDLSGNIIAEKILAERDQPPFDRVAMDGIGICFDQSLFEFKIEDIQRAGEATKSLKNPKNTLEVMTGAPLPNGCDTIVPYEEVEINNGVAHLTNPDAVKKGQNIHGRGKDYHKNDQVLFPGVHLRSPGMAVVTSQGLTEIQTYQIPKIAIVSTGDELVEPGNPIEAHQIRLSNSYAIEAELRSLGIPKTRIDRFHLKDDKEKLITHFKNLLNEYKLIIISGGVSKGKYDFVHSIMGDLNVKTIFHKIKQRPGKPMLFGVGENGQCVFGLPGNPVSALTCLRRYVVEAIREKMGINKSGTQHAVLSEDFEFAKELTYFLAVKINYDSLGRTVATPIKGNGSGDFYSLAKSDGFIELPQDKSLFKKGEALPLFLWGNAR